jgi:hypothetical protein
MSQWYSIIWLVFSSESVTTGTSFYIGANLAYGWANAGASGSRMTSLA